MKLSLAVVVATAVAMPVYGQGILASDEDVEEIIVTTRKREENLQEVPISIGVFSSEDIYRQGLRDLADITQLSPSLQFDQAFSQNSVRVTVRGLSNTRGRSNVAFLVDGIDVTSEVTGTNAGSPLLVNQRLLTDVERIEVVRGPQSALYGRAAFAGAINYISKNPADAFEVDAAVDYDENGKWELFGGVSLPVSDELGFRLTGVKWDDEGVYRNEVSGNKFGGGEGDGFAATALWQPADTLRIKSRVTYTDDEYAPGAVAGIFDRRVTLDVPADAANVTDETSVDLIEHVGDADGLEVRASEDPIKGGDYPGNTLEVWRGSLILDWDIADYTLSSYTGYTNADQSQRYDLDRQAIGRPDQILGHGDVDTFGSTKQYSQELRLASNWQDSAIQVTGGLQYWKEDRDDKSRNISVTCYIAAFCDPDTPPSIPPFFPTSWQDLYAEALRNSGERNPIDAETKHLSAYAMLEWGWTDTVQLTLENRFVKEDFEADVNIGASCVNAWPFNANLDGYGFDPINVRPNCVPGVPDNESTESTYQTPKITLEWQASETALLYALAAKGQKPAGISLVIVPIKFLIPLEEYKFKEEKMWSYEVGAKTSWSGGFGDLIFNTAGFYQDYTDKQTNTQQQFGDFIIGKPTNASAAWVTGIELETTWATPLEGLSFGLGYTWLDSEYDDFKDATRSASRIAQAGTCGEEVEIRGTPHCLLDLSGNEIEFVPEHSLVVTGRYEGTTTNNDIGMDFDWFIEGNASYQDERYTSADNFTRLDDFWVADVRVGLSRDSWDLIFYCDNVFDQDTISSTGGNPDVAAGYVDAAPDLTPPFLATAFLPQPQTFGVRFQYFYR